MKFDGALMLKRPDNWFSGNCSTCFILADTNILFKTVKKSIKNKSNQLSLNHKYENSIPIFSLL